MLKLDDDHDDEGDDDKDNENDDEDGEYDDEYHINVFHLLMGPLPPKIQL